jgi:hypothetical protein
MARISSGFKSTYSKMPLFAKPLRGIGFAGLTFRNNTKIASGEFRVADEVLSDRCFM